MMDFERIKALPPFGEVSSETLRELLPLFQYKNYRHGKTLFYQGDWADKIFFIISGKVRLKKWRQDQTSFWLSEAGQGSFLGIPEILASGEYLTDGECVCETDFLQLPHTHLPGLLAITEFRTRIMEQMAGNLFDLHESLESPGSLSAICRCLKELSKRDSLVHITQEQLANRVGLTRETVSKHLHQLQQDQIIKLGRGNIRILDSEILE